MFSLRKRPGGSPLKYRRFTPDSKAISGDTLGVGPWLRSQAMPPPRTSERTPIKSPRRLHGFCTELHACSLFDPRVGANLTERAGSDRLDKYLILCGKNGGRCRD